MRSHTVVSCRTGRFAPMIVQVILVAALGCGEDAESPTAPYPRPALKSTQAQKLLFRQVSTGGGAHTCGVTAGSVAYCWGLNSDGQLGDGTTTNHLTPVPVAGGLRFHQVAAGFFQTCGVTTNNMAYCWGRNSDGQLGDGTATNRSLPVPVAGGLRFRQVSAGDFHTCGVTTGSEAHCWGRNLGGQLGDGTTIDRPTPVAVAGGLRFRLVGLGSNHSCGVTTSHVAYCWGFNDVGQLGDGTEDIIRPTPVPVVGGLRFRQVISGWRWRRYHLRRNHEPRGLLLGLQQPRPDRRWHGQ
jgi:alpha-tubulin suppressor-like RCC1 family protein